MIEFMPFTALLATDCFGIDRSVEVMVVDFNPEPKGNTRQRRSRLWRRWRRSMVRK